MQEFMFYLLVSVFVGGSAWVIGWMLGGFLFEGMGLDE